MWRRRLLSSSLLPSTTLLSHSLNTGNATLNSLRFFSQSQKGQSYPFQDGVADPRYTNIHNTNNTVSDAGNMSEVNKGKLTRRLNPHTMPHYVKATIQNDRRELGLSEVIDWEEFCSEAICVPTRNGQLWIGSDDPRAAKFMRRREKMKKNPMQIGREKPVKKGKNGEAAMDPVKALESHPLREFFTTATNLNDPLSVANNLYRAGLLNSTTPANAGAALDGVKNKVTGEANIKFVASKIRYRKRRPIVSVMGHVDHGKTTLLDYLRRSNVAAGEAGGITQNVGAFTVDLRKFNSNKQNGNDGQSGDSDPPSDKTSEEAEEDHLITFIDTPGHAAFTAMREVGAAANDFIILVISVADGVQPQTREVIEIAKRTGSAIIVAITKMDRVQGVKGQTSAGGGGSEGVEGIKRTLREERLLELEEDGGDVQVVCVSAKTGEGIPDLLEAIQLQAELGEVSVPTPSRAELLILETSQNKHINNHNDSADSQESAGVDLEEVKKKDDRHKQQIAAVVRCGVVRPGQIMVSGMSYGRIFKLFDERGREISKAVAGMPVLLLGFRVHPRPGNILMQVSSMHHAERYYYFMKEVYELEGGRENYLQLLNSEQHGQFFRRKPDNNNLRVYNDAPFSLIVKAATFGMLQALMRTIYELPRLPGVALEIKNTEVGGLTNTDVMLVSGGGQPGAILEFGEIDEHSQALATLDVPSHIKRIKFNVLYHGIEELQQEMVKLLPPIQRVDVVSRAEVLQLFKASQAGKKGNAAGALVVKGNLEAAHLTYRVRRLKPEFKPSAFASKSKDAAAGNNNANIKDYDNNEAMFDIVYEGPMKELRRFKDLVPTVEQGLECGVIMRDEFSFRVGDVIEGTQTVTVERDAQEEFAAAAEREEALRRQAEQQAVLLSDEGEVNTHHEGEEGEGVDSKVGTHNNNNSSSSNTDIEKDNVGKTVKI